MRNFAIASIAAATLEVNTTADLTDASPGDGKCETSRGSGFCSLRALSTKYNDQPERASRPFDRLRDGFVMGEGAGALVLESAAHAKKRRARMYAEVAGYAATSEAYHMVIPREDGEEIAATMRLAMAERDLHVGEGEPGVRRGDELLALHLEEQAEHGRVEDVPRPDLLLDHVEAGLFDVHR